MRTSGAGIGDGPRAQGERVARAPQFEWLARAGLAARGVVYAVIGILALELAVGDAGRAPSQRGALEEIAAQPFGKILLILVATGLGGYALWRLVRAALGHGPEQADSDSERIAGLASGIAYTILCFTAVKILSGSRSGAGSGSPEKTTGGILDWSMGPLLVGIAGVALVGVAAYQGHKGVSKDFLESSKTEQMSEQVQRAFTVLGVFGHLARAVVFTLVGYGLIKAAIDYDADEAVGLDGALRQVADASYGPWLLGLVAIGFLGFAAYSAADARYRKV